MSTEVEAITALPQQPPGTTILIPNFQGTNTWIALPLTGNLWVGYEYQTQPVNVYIWHQGGTTTPVPPGFNTYKVNANDALVYAQPVGQSIKLGWAYV